MPKIKNKQTKVFAAELLGSRGEVADCNHSVYASVMVRSGVNWDILMLCLVGPMYLTPSQTQWS